MANFELAILCAVFLPLSLQAVVIPATISTSVGSTNYQTECTMCASCDNPCNRVPSPPPPSPPPPPEKTTPACPPPPISGDGGSNYYPPPPPSQPSYAYPPPSDDGGAYNPPPNPGSFPTPPPPNPIMPYFPFYYHIPPPSGGSGRLMGSLLQCALFGVLLCLL